MIGEEQETPRRKFRRRQKRPSAHAHELRSQIESKEKSDKKLVRFVVYAPDAKSVSFSGNFNQWVRLPLNGKRRGLWEITVRLSPGEYKYRFFVDGRMVESIPGCIEVNKVCV